MFIESFKVVLNCDCGGEDGDTACYGCLCNYYNQRHHDILKRRYAISFFRQFKESPDDEWDTAIVEHAEELVEPDSVENNQLNELVIDFSQGIDLKDVPYDEIWQLILQWSNDDNEKKLLADLKTRSDIIKDCEKPISDLNFSIGDVEYSCELIWPHGNMIYFSADNKEGYDAAKKSGWICIYGGNDCSTADKIVEVLKG
jgi:hypothetical protein